MMPAPPHATTTHATAHVRKAAEQATQARANCQRQHHRPSRHSVLRQAVRRWSADARYRTSISIPVQRHSVASLRCAPRRQRRACSPSGRRSAAGNHRASFRQKPMKQPSQRIEFRIACVSLYNATCEGMRRDGWERAWIRTMFVVEHRHGHARKCLQGVPRESQNETYRRAAANPAWP